MHVNKAEVLIEVFSLKCVEILYFICLKQFLLCLALVDIVLKFTDEELIHVQLFSPTDNLILFNNVLF